MEMTVAALAITVHVIHFFIKISDFYFFIFIFFTYHHLPPLLLMIVIMFYTFCSLLFFSFFFFAFVVRGVHSAIYGIIASCYAKHSFNLLV